MDIKTGTNKIGEIVNLSQYLQSIMWNNIFADVKKKDNKDKSLQEVISNHLEMYRDICILSVMSGIEIDKAKKEFEVSTGKELDRLKSKYNVYRKVDDTDKLVKPIFFKMITLNNGYELSGKHIYEHFNTPMDYLQKTIGKFNFHNSRLKDDVIPFSSIVEPVKFGNIAHSYYVRKDRIIDLIKALQTDISKLYIGYDTKNRDERDEINKSAQEIRQECIDYINDISIPDITMYLILKDIDNESNKGYARLIFSTLFGTPNEKFFKLIHNTDNICHLENNSYGTIQIFGMKFIKISA